jgi:hypothetical protein
MAASKTFADLIKDIKTDPTLSKVNIGDYKVEPGLTLIKDNATNTYSMYSIDNNTTPGAVTVTNKTPSAGTTSSTTTVGAKFTNQTELNAGVKVVKDAASTLATLSPPVTPPVSPASVLDNFADTKPYELANLNSKATVDLAINDLKSLKFTTPPPATGSDEETFNTAVDEFIGKLPIPTALGGSKRKSCKNKKGGNKKQKKNCKYGTKRNKKM